MKKRSLYIFLLPVLCLMFFASCKSKKVLTQTAIPKKSTRFLLKKMNENKVDVEWFCAKGKIKYRDKNESIKAEMSIRLRKDSVLWMNVKKFGKEAFRVLITTDSVYLMDRLNKEYMIQGLDFVGKKFGLPEDFKSMQKIILGNALFISDKKPDSKIKKNQYFLSSEKDNVRSEYWLEGGTYNLTKMLFSDIRNDRTISMEMENYDKLDDEQKFSYFRNLNVNAEETGKIEMSLKFSNVEINTPKSTKFEISKRYKRVN